MRTFTRAYALAPDEAATLGAQPAGVLLQVFVTDGAGNVTYAGTDTWLPGPTPDAAAMDDILAAAGWTRVDPWDTCSGQHIADVTRTET